MSDIIYWLNPSHVDAKQADRKHVQKDSNYGY